MIENLCKDTIKVYHTSGEDASGVAIVAEYDVMGAFDSGRASVFTERGANPANSGSAVMIATGYGISWHMVVGDRLVCRSVSVQVTSIKPIFNRWSGLLHHLEVSYG